MSEPKLSSVVGAVVAIPHNVVRSVSWGWLRLVTVTSPSKKAEARPASKSFRKKLVWSNRSLPGRPANAPIWARSAAVYARPDSGQPQAWTYGIEVPSAIFCAIQPTWARQRSAVAVTDPDKPGSGRCAASRNNPDEIAPSSAWKSRIGSGSRSRPWSTPRCSRPYKNNCRRIENAIVSAATVVDTTC
jgi:hypothetical protein